MGSVKSGLGLGAVWELRLGFAALCYEQREFVL